MPNLAADLSGAGVAGGWGPSLGLPSWNVDLRPDTPNAMNDEFDAATLDTAKWTAVGSPGGNFAVAGAPGAAANTLDTVRKMLRVTSAAAAGQRWGWVVQPIAAPQLTDCTIITKCFLSAISGNNGTAGLVLGATDLGSAPTTADFFTIERYNVAGGLGVVARRYSAYTTVAATVQNYAGPEAKYLAISLTTAAGVTTVVPYWSNDGVSWNVLGTYAGTALPFAVGFAGVGADCNVVGNDGIARFDFFRVFPGTAARDTTTLGRLASIPLAP